LTAEHTLFDTLIENGLKALLIFTPLAFGTVHKWSLAVMEVLAFAIFFLHLIQVTLRRRGNGSSEPKEFRPKRERLSLLAGLGIFWSLLILLALFQMLPLPQALLEAISPATLATWQNFGNSPPNAFHSISLHIDATRREITCCLAYAAVFLVIAGHFRTKEQITSLLKTLLSMSAFLMAVALTQKMTWNGRMLWFYPVSEYLKSGSGIWGPYVNRDHFAGYLEMVIPLGIGFLLYRLPRIPELPGTPWRVRLARFLASDHMTACSVLFVLVLAMSAVLFSTFSRGGILAYGGSLLMLAFLCSKRRSLKRRALPLAILALVVLVTVVFSSWDRLEDRFSALERDHVSRLEVWQDAIRIVQDYPVLGTGLGTFKNGFMRYQRSMSRSLFDHAHNDYLELATDTGIVGFLIGMGLVVYFFWNVLRRWRKKHSMFGKCIGLGGMGSICAIAVHSFVDFNLHIPANALLLTVIVSMTYVSLFILSESKGRAEAPGAADGIAKTESVGIPSSNLKRTLPWVAAILLLAFLLLAVPVRDFVADGYYRKLDTLLDDPETEGMDVVPITEKSMPAYLAAIEALKQAEIYAPFCSRYPAGIADLYQRIGNWTKVMASLNAPLPTTALATDVAFREVLQHLQRAIRLEPIQPDYHLSLGMFYDQTGEPEKATEALQKAAMAYPVNAPLRYAIAMQSLISGRYGDALAHARVLAAIDDSYILRDSVEKADLLERQPPGYIALIRSSYLYGALEIAWRISHDPQVVMGIAPDTADAAPVVALFLNSR
jgi:O-antigen ligase/tetratricopeptide (TPR) repeat protein